MARLFGEHLTRHEIARRSGNLGAFGGVRLMELSDGLERGIRMLEFRTGSGLRFTVLVDRAMDIAEVDYKGQSLGWYGPSGVRHPGLHEYDSEGGFAWGRSFSGFLVTCGLDHILGPEEVSAQNYNYPGVKTIKHGLHGRISIIPAKLTGYGERWEGDRCILWAEAQVRQAATFGENLTLYRRIEADLGGNEIRLTDRVENTGFLPTPHMFFYHINLGAPLLAEGTRYLAPITDVVWAAHEARYATQAVGYQTTPAPQVKFAEQVWQHETAPDAAGEVPVALVNDRLGLGVEVTFRKDQLPCLYEWQHFQEGGYAFGIEPSTHHVLGDSAARKRGEMIWLGAQEARTYDTRFRVLDGAAEIAETAARIAAIARQPADDFPKPSGQFRPLTGRGKPA
ncbi:MAG: aldose 1-epimerase family protein [Paracoccaceae bacterium]